jgi:hypothetical protein
MIASSQEDMYAASNLIRFLLIIFLKVSQMQFSILQQVIRLDLALLQARLSSQSQAFWPPYQLLLLTLTV